MSSRAFRAGPAGMAKAFLHKLHLSHLRPQAGQPGRPLLEFFPVELRGFIDHVPGVDQSLEVADTLLDPRHLQCANLLQVARQPGRVRVIPGQGMALGGDPLFPAPLRHLLDVILDRHAGLGLVRGPVEGQRGEVEHAGELLAVGVLIPGVVQVSPHEDVAAEQEGMAFLLDGDFRTRNRFAGGIDHDDDGIGLAVFLDPRRRPGEQFGIRRSRGRDRHRNQRQPGEDYKSGTHSNYLPKVLYPLRKGNYRQGSTS